MISVLQATIDTLQGQLEVKDRQIEQQAQTITRLTDALAAAQQTAAAAQALHAGTIQQQLITGEAGTDQQEPEQKKAGFQKFLVADRKQKDIFSSLQVKKGGVIQ